MIKIMNIVGARPNFVKISSLMKAYKNWPDVTPLLIHTGQHYDEKMSDLFFRHLGIAEPDLNLGIGSASHAVQTAEIMKAFEPIVLREKPDAVLVVGDVNSTIACGLVAVKLGIPLIHVEAGLRSFDRTMPEEINRILTDSISSYLFCTEEDALDNLRKEGIADDKMFFVGNVMIDTLLHHRKRSEESHVLSMLDLQPKEYGVLTLHRPGNVDDLEVFEGILDALESIQNELPLIFPVHPRTRNSIQRFGLEERIAGMSQIRLVEPLGYLDFLKLIASSALVLTDSGGIQEETTILKVPCFTLRPNTERPVTCKVGSNVLVGTETQAIRQAFRKLRDQESSRSFGIPPLWDGNAGQRIVDILREKLGAST